MIGQGYIYFQGPSCAVPLSYKSKAAADGTIREDLTLLRHCEFDDPTDCHDKISHLYMSIDVMPGSPSNSLSFLSSNVF